MLERSFFETKFWKRMKKLILILSFEVLILELVLNFTLSEFNLPICNLPIQIFLSSLFIAIFLPSLYTQSILNDLRKGIKRKERIIKKTKKIIEYEELKYIPKTLGELERLIFYTIICFLYPQNLSYFFIFFGVWIATKTYVTNKIWEEAGTKNFHIGRAKFLIYLIGNILSFISVGIIFAITRLLF